MELAFLSGKNADILKFINLNGLIPALFIFVAAIFLLRLTSQSLDALGEQIPTRRLLLKQISVITRFVLVALAFVLIVISVLELSGESFSFFGGLILFGFSFASRDLIASLMAGLILLFDRPFQVGDRISFAGHYGEVIEIGLRSVRMIDLDDNQISIPNNQFLNSPVSSANAGQLDQMCVFHFYIGCKEDFRLAEQIVYEAVAASRYVYWGKPIFVLMKESPVPHGAGRFAVLLTAKAYVIDGRYEAEFGSDVHKRVKEAFQDYKVQTAGELEWRRMHL